MHENHHPSLMDAAFHLDEVARSNFIQILMQSLGSTYACLWSFSAPSSCLSYSDGLFWDSGNVQSNAVFNKYKQSLFVIPQSHGQVPGWAFMNNLPFIELREDRLLTLARNDSQRQFYQEAGIKIAIFMGCNSGEIELGFSDVPQSDLEMLVKRLFPEDFSRHLPIQAENSKQNLPSSSSSSLRSLSMDSPEYSSLLFGLSATTPSSCQALLPTPTTTTTAANFLTQLTGFPIAESEHAAMTSAFLAVMTSPSLSSTSQQAQQQQQQQWPQQHQPPWQNPQPSAFTRYVTTRQFKPRSSRRPSMLKRAIENCRSMNLIRIRERMQGAAAGSGSINRPISVTQMHHMISERKRREKLNKSFQSLKTLLPPGTKKDKASVLSATKEYLSSLKSQVEELRRKNAILEAQRLPPPAKDSAADETTSTSSGHDQSRSRVVEVDATTVSNSASTSSQVRIVDLQVVVRRSIQMLDLVIRILEFLKQTRNINVLSIESDSHVTQQDGMINHVSLRLHVEGDAWNESAFQEAVRRLVADLAQ